MNIKVKVKINVKVQVDVQVKLKLKNQVMTRSQLSSVPPGTFISQGNVKCQLQGVHTVKI